MNPIRDSMKNIRATEELKQNTLQYLYEQEKRDCRTRTRLGVVRRLALAAVSILLLVGIGGYSVYRQPVSYISVDVNPSIELSVNRFGRVVSTEAFNNDGRDIAERVPLRNLPYMQAIGRLLEDESCLGFLREDSILVFTVVSDQAEKMIKELNASELLKSHGALTYTSDASCMHEAHQHQMSFGKYRTYLELLKYDGSVTIDDCHSMTMGEMRDKIDACAHEGEWNTGEEKHNHGKGHECND